MAFLDSIYCEKMVESVLLSLCHRPQVHLCVADTTKTLGNVNSLGRGKCTQIRRKNPN